MGERWIVGIDGSFASRAALIWTLAHAEPRGAEVVAVSAYPGAVGGRLVGRPADHEQAETVATAGVALHELDAAIADIVGDRDVERRVVAGSPGRVLSAIAGEEGANLLVVGRHGTGGHWYQVIGSVSRYCVRRSPVPIAVVPADWEPGSTSLIVAGFDASANSAAAVRWAVDFAPADAHVRALMALEVPSWQTPDLVVSHLADALSREERRMLDALDIVDPSGLVERDVVVKGARPALAAAAQRADLLVLGSHGSGRLPGNPLGSVSTWMLDIAPCPVVVVPDLQGS
jgi:nucleotide-binding universal stress UspA family protein